MAHASKAGDAPEGVRSRIVELLNRQLADSVDLRLQARQAALNVSGPYESELRSLFNGLARDLRDSIDLIAAQINALGGQAITAVRVVAHQSNIREYPEDAVDAHEHLMALLSGYSRYGLDARNAMNKAQELGGAGTGQLLEAICTSIERNLWLLEAHLEGIAVHLLGRRLPRWTPAFESYYRTVERDQSPA